MLLHIDWNRLSFIDIDVDSHLFSDIRSFAMFLPSNFTISDGFGCGSAGFETRLGDSIRNRVRMYCDR